MLTPICADITELRPGANDLYLYQDIPVDGCLGWYWLGASYGRSTVNGVRGGRLPIIRGAPEIKPYWLGMQGRVDYLDAQFSDTIEGTYLVAFRSTDTNGSNTNRPTAIGTAADGNDGSNVHVSSGTSVRLGVGTIDGSGNETFEVSGASVAAPGSDVTNWGCYLAWFTASQRQIINLTTGATSSMTSHTGERQPSGGNIVIGGDVGTLRQGKCDVLMGAYFNVAIIDSEQQAALYALVKQQGADVGIML